MKRIILFVLIVCLCLTACGGAVFGEVDQSAEELWKAGEDAWKAKDYDRAMEYYQMAADQGNAEGWRSIGSLYYNAEGVEQSSEKALKYWQRAADQGDAKALTNLALLYRKGEGVELDYEKAMEYYQQAVDGGDTKGLIGLGTMYYGGEGVEQSYAKAMEYWQQAADQGDTDAMVYIAYLYGHGEGVAQDFDKTMELYQRAAALGNLDATAYIGNMYLFGDGVEQDYAKAAEYYIPAAEAGNAYAQSNLAWLYTTGNGVALNQRKAAAYYQQAAEQGYSYAQANLASMYAEGKGVEQDYAKALEYYQLAADQGNGHAYAGLGDLYAQGNGVEQDDAKALEYYQQAADLGSDYALAALGALYAEGDGVEQDYARALEYFQQAADRDVAEGFYGLGELYAEGNGVEKDEKKAIEYYRRAARGDEAAEDAPDAPAAEAPTFEEKTVKVFTDGKEAGELPLRFYDATPNIPYLGMTQYAQYIFDQPLTLRTGRDGVCALANEAGVELLCDADLGVIVARDWNGFCDLPFPLENRGRRWKDTGVPFVRITGVEYEGTPKPVVLDFAKYGIRIYSDESDVYLPVSTLTNMMADIATNHLLYNGENLYAEVVDLEGNPPEGFFDSGRYAAELNGEERPADIVAQSYADLCFAFDYFFGHPGKAALDDAIAGVGLDRALNDLGEAGASIRAGLHSTDLKEYLSAMNALFFEYLSDGHTVFMGNNVLDAAEPLDAYSMAFGMYGALFNSPVMMRQLANEYIPIQRDFIWGDERYIESGHTAIIRLDSFMPDEAAWESYYKGEGELPGDGFGTVVAGLRRASANPEIRNVIFDLSANSGGSSDVMMAMLAVTTGQDRLYGVNRITGQKLTLTYEADANFDGAFDEKDRAVKYDFNYGVLTTRHAFSCGNLFPIIVQEAGAVIIGEKTSGGSCCIQIASDAEGLMYMMSSGQWCLRDSEGNDVEGGCTVDLPIPAESNVALDGVAGMLNIYGGVPSYKAYFDAAKLDEMMNDWFAEQAEVKPAA